MNLEGYQGPNVKDTHKILNKYVFLYIEIKCNSRQINEFRIFIHFRWVKKLRYSQSIYHERYRTKFFRSILNRAVYLHSAEKVQVGKDQEKAQSEKDSHSKNRAGKKNKLTIRYLYHETYRKPNEQLFSIRPVILIQVCSSTLIQF